MARRGSPSGPRGSRFVQITTIVIAVVVVLSMVLSILPVGQ